MLSLGAKWYSAIAIAALALLVIASPASAQFGFFSWLPAGPGPHNWNAPANWDSIPFSGIFPNSNASIASIEVSFTAAPTINLNQPITIEDLTLGSAANRAGITLQSQGGSLTFDNSSSSISAIGHDVTHRINADVKLISNLEVFTLTDTNLTVSGVISGSGRLKIVGNLTLTNGNTYTGGTENFGILSIVGAGSIGGDILNHGTLVFDFGVMTSGSLNGLGTTIVRGAGDLTVSVTSPNQNGLVRADDGRLNVNASLGGSGTVMLNGTSKLNANASITNNINGASSGSLIVVGGNVTLGNAASATGFQHAGQLVVGGNTLTLGSAGFANLGSSTTLAGGTIVAANGVVLGVGDNLIGSGSVQGKVATGAGSLIVATGDLSLGSANAFNGFASSDGVLQTGPFAVTLLDRNQAGLGALTEVGNGSGAGTLTSDHGFVIDFGSALVGYGAVNNNNLEKDALINNGQIHGEGLLLADALTLNGYVKGVGDFSGNVLFNGTFAPGLSPAEVDLENMRLGDLATLQVELGGFAPGSQFDVLNVSNFMALDGTLDVQLINGFTPSLGDSFTFARFGQLRGSFDRFLGFDLGGGLTFDLRQNPSDLTLVVVAVPEPSSLALTGLAGSATAVLALRRRKRAQRPRV